MENESSGVAGLQQQLQKRPKNVQVEEAENGFIVNMGYRSKVKVAKTKEEVTEFISEYLNEESK